MKWMNSHAIRVAVMVTTALMIESCGASWHLKRAIAIDPTIVQTQIVRMDTTIVTPERIVHDTIVTRAVDTIELFRDNVRIQLVRNYDTIAVNVECPSDTIRIVRDVAVSNVCPPESFDWSRWLGWVIVVLLSIYIIRRLRF
jgi:hypothetical protein